MHKHKKMKFMKETCMEIFIDKYSYVYFLNTVSLFVMELHKRHQMINIFLKNHVIFEKHHIKTDTGSKFFQHLSNLVIGSAWLPHPTAYSEFLQPRDGLGCLSL